MIYTKEFVISESDSAKFMKSGSLACLATPACIAMAENTCFLLSEKIIEEHETTVGTFIEFTHVRPTLIGETIRIETILLNKEHHKFEFEFAIYQEKNLLGKGRHNRSTVNAKEFMLNIEDKRTH